MFSAALYAHVPTLLPIAQETAGAARIRHSLRPLFREGEEFRANLGRNAPRDRETVSTRTGRRAPERPATPTQPRPAPPRTRTARHPSPTHSTQDSIPYAPSPAGLMPSSSGAAQEPLKIG